MAGRSALRPPPRNPFWSFSLRVYRRPGVAPACLALQDRLGLDVNVLLLCLWAAARGWRLRPRTMAAAVELSQMWSTTVVRPLRGVRRALKPMDKPGLRALVARVELAAEKLEQAMLHDIAMAAPPAQASAEDAAIDNLLGYVRRARLRLAAADRRHLVAVVAAALPRADAAGIAAGLRRA